MTEYILIVALIAIASIGVVTAFGDNVRHLFGMAGDAFTGVTDGANRAKKVDQSKEQKTLADFAQKHGTP